jgi:NADH oxidase (H2O2-forming)
MRKIIILGAGAAGQSVATYARKTDRQADIKIIGLENIPAYSRCGLPFAISGEIKDINNLITFPMDFYKMMRIDLKIDTKATKVDTKNKKVIIKQKNAGEEELEYDTLVFSTGSDPILLPIKGKEKKGIYLLRTIKDGQVISEAIKQSKEAVVIGGGFIGLEVADALMVNELRVKVIEMLPQALRTSLDEEMAKIIHEKMKHVGVDLMLNKKVEEFFGEEKVKGVISNGEEIRADMVIMAVGVRSNTGLASDAGLKIGSKGGIVTNSRMETSVKDVYAAGDCVECKHLVTSSPTLSQLGTTAVRQGRVAGINAAGGNAEHPNVLGSAVSRFFDLEVGSTGLTEWQAREAGIETVSGSIPWRTRSEYHPEHKDIRVKLVVERRSTKVIGGQIIGGEKVAERINMISLAIQGKMTVHDVLKADTCYVPPLADVWDPVVLAAESVIRRMT